ncbi:MAG: serine/threonine-protein kinase, partial [Gemmataceae bacterium]
MSPLPRVPGYELIEPLGGGPMTCVYAARELATDDRVAVKLPRPDWSDADTAFTLIRREARAGLAVRHRHLIRVRAMSDDDPPFLVMDLLPGESLRQRLQRDYRLDPVTALSATRQTAAAIAALHRQNFVHGDVKPENVRLVAPGAALLIDLGFAHRPGENAAFLDRGLILGTANYLAPEQCEANYDGDGRGDLFALGVTLFELLTGRLPYPPG